MSKPRPNHTASKERKRLTMIMRPVAIILILNVSISALSTAQKINVNKMDSLFDALAARELAMGSVSISQNGQVLYEKAIGYSYLDNLKKIPASTSTKYRIGSGSKMFTAVMILQLVEQGKIKLNDKLSDFFPSLPNANKITISHLLYHRSGLHNYTDETNFQQWMNKAITHDTLLKIIAGKGARFDPGSQAEYSNSNYVVLSYIIEQVDKTSYADALKKRIVSRIGLTNTAYGAHINVHNNESASYKFADGGWRPEKETDMSIHSGAGSIVSTPADMTRFIDALFANRLMSKQSLAKMMTLVDGYGMGLFPLNHGTRIAYGHNGRIEEFYSSTRYFPVEKISVTYITNGIVYPRTDLLEGILKICFNQPFTLPFSHPIRLESADLDQYLGSYSSRQIPINVNCIKNGTKLLMQTGQATFEVEPINENYFMHAHSGSFFEFFPGKSELLIKETDNVYFLKKK